MGEERDLVDQIREVGRRLWEEHGGTPEAFAAWLNQLEAQHPERFRSPGSRAPTDEQLAEIRRTFGD
jgi:hypothetical protein